MLATSRPIAAVGLLRIHRVLSVRFKSSQTLHPTANDRPDTIRVVPSVTQLTQPEQFENDAKLSLVGLLQLRHLVETVSHEELFKATEPHGKKFSLYCGADPTASSLHIGNLLPLMVLLHFALRGHAVVGLVGGATGAVGDPSGRTSERSQILGDEREANVERIRAQIGLFLENGVAYARSRNFPIGEVGDISTANNASWWKNIGMLDFLAQYGRHIRVSSMLGRDSIASRLKSQAGLGFHEFTYQILQAYDFWHLFRHHKVNVQVGGNDQWGNITAGIDLISRLLKQPGENEGQAYGLTVPLLTTPTGEKFGKSAGNAVFISDTKTTPYQLYQYFINTPDEMVVKLLKAFTLLPTAAIDGVLMPEHEADPGVRIAQRVLAREVVDLVHGVGTGDEMAYITSFLFPTPDQPFNDEISADKLVEKFGRLGILSRYKFSDFGDIADLKLSTLLATVLRKSKSETKQLIKAGGIYLGLDRDQFVDPENVVLFDRENHLIDGKLMLVRTGKQSYYVAVFE